VQALKAARMWKSNSQPCMDTALSCNMTGAMTDDRKLLQGVKDSSCGSGAAWGQLEGQPLTLLTLLLLLLLLL
jgi:hypothetical protein